MLGLWAAAEEWTLRGWQSLLVRRSLRPYARASFAAWSILRKRSWPPMGLAVSLLCWQSRKMLESEAGSSVEQARSECEFLQSLQSLLRWALREGSSARVGKKDLADSIIIITHQPTPTPAQLAPATRRSRRAEAAGQRQQRQQGRGSRGSRGQLAACDNNMNNQLRLDRGQEVGLQECEEHSDLFSLFIREVMGRAPLIYVFINIILVIWIAQTILSSHLSSIPHSLYLLSPLLAATPYSRLSLQPAAAPCPPGQQPLPLKSLPTIYSNRISHQQLFAWDPDSLHFCAAQLNKQRKSASCRPPEVQCSGYCVKTSADCPVTKLKVSPTSQPLEPGFEQIYRTTEGKSFRISRADGVPIIAIKVAYETKCANDEYYNEAFNTEEEFWQKAEDCAQEGSIAEFFSLVDRMDTNSFFAVNEVGITTTNSSMREVLLGTVPEFHFSSDASKGCSQASGESASVKEYLTAAAPAPQFSGILTGFSFVLLVVSLLWVLGHYYIPQWAATLNIITFGISVIELVIVGFIYSNNVELFRLEQLTQTLRKCLDEQLPALKEWDFGMQSPQAFQMLLFANTAYLGLHISALLYDHFCLHPYRRPHVLLPHIPPRL